MEKHYEQINEICKWKFPYVEKISDSDETTIKYLLNLYNEIGEYLKNNEIVVDDLGNDDCENLKLNDGELPPNKIPFVVVKDKNTFIDYKCPFCNNENDKICISLFNNSQYSNYTCPSCEKTFLGKLEFIPSVKLYGEI